MSRSIQTIKNQSQLSKFAKEIAKRVLAHPVKKGATVIALVGNLGAGKTTFTQALLKDLGVTGRIMSPTFILMRPYVLKKVPFHTAYHIDAYRIEKNKELLDLGIKKIFAQVGHLVIIEWADLVKKLIPKSALWIELKHGKGKSERIILH